MQFWAWEAPRRELVLAPLEQERRILEEEAAGAPKTQVEMWSKRVAEDRQAQALALRELREAALPVVQAMVQVVAR